MDDYEKVVSLVLKAQYTDYKLTRKDLGLILDYVVKSRYGKEMKK
jgi:hypothetical protein